MLQLVQKYRGTIKLREKIQPLVSIGIRGLSLVAGFAITLALGHKMGATAIGQYSVITQSALFLSVLAVGGLDLAIVRLCSAALSHGVALQRALILEITLYSSALVALVIMIAIFAQNHGVAVLFQGEAPQGALAALIAIMLSRVLTRIAGALLRSQKAYSWGQAVEVLLIPAVVLVQIQFSDFTNASQVLIATAISGVIIGLLALAACWFLAKPGRHPDSPPIKAIFRVAVPLWGVAIFLNIADWYALATASALFGIEEAGRYRVALQIGNALSIVSMAMFSLFSPQISAAYARKDLHAIGRIARTATRLSIIIVLPIALVLSYFAQPILIHVREDFAPAEIVLQIAIFGQAAYAMFGPSGLVMAMTGHERIQLAQTVIGTLAILVAAPVAGYYFGLAGISLSVTLVLVSRNAFSMYSVWKLLGINVMTGKVRPRPVQED
ncbi:oligosaccharide flippase family protein [Sphingobium sufflavum]|uniref:lipopolysaccharide biosynthesis protein n=1 Tax=Sphingobium sufflavum TaxID=1129547 RepID=UPI001F2E5F4D|nr:MATE family efflux transporter [Sphingobium sufflavum]MCE7798516.1 oligosaccharide flippase family protein [Sphingobium sufflavum]